MTDLNIEKITQRIVDRSKKSRSAYLQKIEQQRQSRSYRRNLSCGNLAHGFAACDSSDKDKLANSNAPNIGIVSAYNDMLSAHQPYQSYPEIIKQIANSNGASAQFAGGVPAMCDGVTQGLPGMELSLFSRDNIAMSTAIALSHQMFDGAIYLGICDKIVPGLLIGALSFGFLPGIFIPAGPMKSGISNKEKAKVRQQFANGEVDEQTLLETESASYHSPGTCTFYGTANSNQMLMEIMGLQLPGSSFENPESELRTPLTQHAVLQLLNNIEQTRNNSIFDLSEIVTEKSIVNGTVGLLATGGSTNHTIHLIAIARAAGIQLTWEDMSDLSKIVPLLCRVYPNGQADVNHFHQAGGMPYLISELLDAGLLNDDVKTIMGETGLSAYCKNPQLATSSVIAQTADTSGANPATKPTEKLQWKTASRLSKNFDILRSVNAPFLPNGGLTLLEGNIGQSVIKTSAIEEKHQFVQAPAKVFESQEAMIEAFNAGELEQDFVAVIIFQGPKANGMPELHKLTPILGSLQDRGFKVALVTDGRMSGASGKVPAAIHLTPEAVDGGPIGQIRDDDQITLDCQSQKLSVALTDVELQSRGAVKKSHTNDQYGIGRELFDVFRKNVNSADKGACVFNYHDEQNRENLNE
ncbi:phosphogluconate dehydratase [Aliikangiella coralliicola]|uniref:Phosphogluconate dehydratase n=1 Tax=Aliikangiella coralliicola TaxID=2592383 RepID=A0A545UHJ4_9GAMM|nr:phosphogluconate dehydratase [Aliikangiella coralliicola]TQV88935.1 phosphogluconate dehydratase [Aliikangiella coralliicola]